MSTVKVNEVRHLSNTGTANVVLESNATTNLQATSTLGLTVTGTLTVSGVSTFNGNMVVGNATTDTVDLQSKVTGFNNFSGFTGEIRMYAGNEGPNAPPTGWLYCNGDTISSLTGNGGTHYNADGKGNNYEPLFNLLKTNNNWDNSGSPSWGTNTVKLPDFRSRSPVGVNTGAANTITSGLTARAIGVTVGAETHALITAELASHTHVMTNPLVSTGVTVDQDSHTHTFTSGVPNGSGNTSSVDPGDTNATDPGDTNATDPGDTNATDPGDTNSTDPGDTNTSGSHNHTLYHSTHSGDSATQQYGIGAGWSGSWGQAYTNYQNINAAGAHSHSSAAHSHSSASHTHTGASHSHSSAAHTHTSVAHTHTLSSHTHTGTTASTDPVITMTDPTHRHVSTAATTGSGTAHTILSPIIAVNYIIKV